MMADVNHRIVYANPSVKQLFAEHLPDFRQALPRFDPNALMGESMGIFHKNPAHQERMVSAMTRPHVARVAVGSRTFDLVVSPVTDGAGRTARRDAGVARRDRRGRRAG